MKSRLTRMNFPELLLPDGTRADRLRLGPLYDALEKIGVPGIEPHMGKISLLEIYETHLATTKTELLAEATANAGGDALAVIQNEATRARNEALTDV